MKRIVLALSACACAVMLWAARPAMADDFFFFDDILNELDEMASSLEVVVDNVDDEDTRAEIKESLDAVIARLTEISDRLGPPGQWYTAYSKSCPQFCHKLGLQSMQSEEGAQCTSGENRFPSAQGKVHYKWGTWGGMRQSYATSSRGGYCYGPGQKKDYDRTDRTVACYCGQ